MEIIMMQFKIKNLLITAKTGLIDNTAPFEVNAPPANSIKNDKRNPVPVKNGISRQTPMYYDQNLWQYNEYPLY